jgi:DNA-directed RNA polymerase subunit RPC12/RpoP
LRSNGKFELRIVVEKRISCAKCGELIVLTGSSDGSKEVPHGVTCPTCGHPNEVMWPMNIGWKIFVPTKPS